MIKSITGVNNVEFEVLDFWGMNPKAPGGRFDVVLNFGVLYHLPKPQALEVTKSMARKKILLDTAVYPSISPLIRLQCEELFDIRCTSIAGVVAGLAKVVLN